MSEKTTNLSEKWRCFLSMIGVVLVYFYWFTFPPDNPADLHSIIGFIIIIIIFIALCFLNNDCNKIEDKLNDQANQIRELKQDLT